MNVTKLMRMAVKGFPRTDYVDDALVRRNRRKLIESINRLRVETKNGWIADNKVQKVQ